MEDRKIELIRSTGFSPRFRKESRDGGPLSPAVSPQSQERACRCREEIFWERGKGEPYFEGRPDGQTSFAKGAAARAKASKSLAITPGVRPCW